MVFVIFIIWFLREIKISKLNKRINRYSIETTYNRHSLFDIITNFFVNIRNKISKILSKSVYLKKYSIKYEKYIDKKTSKLKPMDYVSTKFILGIVSIFILIVSVVINNESITFMKVFIAFTLGFFALDIILLSKNKIILHQMKNDLLKAITIMNNSFKSGRSIVQTIKIVSDEIDGPLKDEFKKMYEDLSYGLEIEAVFERFNSRVNLKEVKYITTSLTILNKTGGNIVDVFASIEKTVFNNKKLEDELHNLSAASKTLYRILVFIPIIFTLVIYILDSTYFVPLFTNPLGIVIVIVIVLLYILYIIIVKKIIRIKEV
jgi:tight adherence protein B